MDGRTATPGAGGTRDVAARRRLPPRERREQIVEEAVRFFAEKGLDGKTRDLAKRLGVTQSLIFNYFATKDDLIEAVYEKVYIDILSPDWPDLLTDRTVPLRERLLAFYDEYSGLIFQREWMRIFMFSGLAGEALNRRYLEHLSDVILRLVLSETRALATKGPAPSMEDILNLHGGIVYVGIRQHIYQMATPAEPHEAISRAIDKHLAYFGIGRDE
jgi:AcrR family transcriptional regulator